MEELLLDRVDLQPEPPVRRTRVMVVGVVVGGVWEGCRYELIEVLDE
jgi:hypothetical protein